MTTVFAATIAQGSTETIIVPDRRIIEVETTDEAIIIDNGGADLFAHATSLAGVSELHQGQRVTFELVFDTKRSKYRALNVRLL